MLVVSLIPGLNRDCVAQMKKLFVLVVVATVVVVGGGGRLSWWPPCNIPIVVKAITAPLVITAGRPIISDWCNKMAVFEAAPETVENERDAITIIVYSNLAVPPGLC